MHVIFSEQMKQQMKNYYSHQDSVKNLNMQIFGSCPKHLIE